MEDGLEDHDVRMAAVQSLEAKGYKVKNAASGSGVPAYSRVSIEKDGKLGSCAIKVTTSGRIRFARAEDGTYDVLRDSDYVIHALRDRERGRIVLSMFDARTIADAFEENHAELVRRGKTNLPQWLNPRFESGFRFVGSGYGDKALWSETVEGDGGEAPPEEREEPGIMDQIKRMLAEHLKVDPSKIEVDVRVKL